MALLDQLKQYFVNNVETPAINNTKSYLGDVMQGMRQSVPGYQAPPPVSPMAQDPALLSSMVLAHQQEMNQKNYAPDPDPKTYTDPSSPTPTQQPNVIQQGIQAIDSRLSDLNPLQKGAQPAQAADITSKIQQTFPDDPDTARAVAMQESSLRPDARNHIPDRGIDAIGLMQINLPAHMDKVPGDTYDEKVKNLMDPDINLKVAKQIHDRQGWQPWEAYTSQAYKKYLN